MKKLILWLFVSLGLLVLGHWKVSAKFKWFYPPLNQLMINQHYQTDMASLALGSHRAAADLGYIQWLQYYGDPSNMLPEGEHVEELDHGHENEEHEHHEDEFSDEVRSASYILLGDYGRRIMRLDPFFNGAIIEVAGALAFNVKRTQEALSYLEESIERDPSYYRYQTYLAAILYRQEGRDEALISVLEEAIAYPDCPVLLENILANLFKKFGHYEKAARVYLHTLENAPRAEDQDTAKKALVKLIQNHPFLVDRLQADLQKE